tara:strand:- start:1222 stop:1323 length:102 start_codon:yes stop_codon:yes gene_type:complete
MGKPSDDRILYAIDAFVDRLQIEQTEKRALFSG